MKVALIGIRGIPVVYSGYETFSEIIATELVKKGHAVTVYCRGAYVDPSKKWHKGVRLITLPTFVSKNFDTIIHSFISTIHACFYRYDAILFLSVGNSIFSIFPRLLGIRTVVNVDGMDWKRKKWGWFAKKFLNYSEYLATILPNAIVTDSHFIKSYYTKKYRKESHYIPYGGFVGDSTNDAKVLKKYSLKKRSYFIWNGRIVPDNHIDELVQAYRKVKTSLKCLILGDDLYKSEYKIKLHSMAHPDKRIIFPGFLAHSVAEALVRNAYAYIETKRSGGTHPSLVEAMSVGALIISDDCTANKEVLGETALFYSQEKGAKSLTQKMNSILNVNKRAQLQKLRLAAKRRAQKTYGWRNIVLAYEKVLSMQ